MLVFSVFTVINMVNVTGRINARKILLSYLYQHCFFSNLIKKGIIITESLFIGNIFKTDSGKFDQAKDELISKFKEHISNPSAEEMKEFSDMFFDQRKDEDIDFDYLSKVAKDFIKYEPALIEKVNAHAVSFTYDEMDTIDQAIFLL